MRGDDVLACRTQGAGQWISRAGRPFEIARTQSDSLWLQEDTVAAALDVERPTVRAIAARIGHDGVGRRLRIASCTGLVE
jgi:hypothetical protein